MIVTSVVLTDIVHDDSSSPNAALLLASHVIDNTAKLIWCNWLASNKAALGDELSS